MISKTKKLSLLGDLKQVGEAPCLLIIKINKKEEAALIRP